MVYIYDANSFNRSAKNRSVNTRTQHPPTRTRSSVSTAATKTCAITGGVVPTLKVRYFYGVISTLLVGHF